MLAMAPFCLLFTILALPLVETKGNPGGLAVNEKPGEVNIGGSFSAPDFSITTLNNGPILSKSSLEGKFVLVDFWSSWCPPCRAEAQLLADLYRGYEETNIEFIGVAVWDTPAQVLRHIEKYTVEYPNSLDLKGEMAISFGLKGIPEKYLLNPNGDVIAKFTGPSSREQLSQFIKENTDIHAPKQPIKN